MAQIDVSVIIPAYERPLQLTRLLEALAQQDYPKDRFEVIVIDDGGSRPLEPTIAAFAQNLQVRLVRQKNTGPAAGRNNGVRHAAGRLVAFTDDDCEPARDWLSALISAADEHPQALLGGRTVPGLPHELCPAASQLIQDIVYDFYNADPGNAKFFASNNMAIAAAEFVSLGGFDAAFRVASEDRDFCERWRRSGGRMVYVPRATVYHFHRMNLTGFVRQHFRYGRGAAQFHGSRVPMASGELWHSGSLHRQWRSWIFRPWRENSGMRAAALTMLMGVWQAANFAGFLYGWVLERGSRK